MGWRWLRVLFVVSVIVPVSASTPRAAQEAPVATGRLVWAAEEKLSFQVSTVHQNLERTRRYRWRVRFAGVQDAAGATRTSVQRRWLSRRVEWAYESYARGPGTFFEDGRRWPVTSTTTCHGSGESSLGATEGEYHDGWPTVSLRCETVSVADDDSNRVRRGRTTEETRLNVRLDWPRRGCADGESRRTVDRQGGVETASWSLAVSPYVEADVRVDRGFAYPTPGSVLELEGSAAAPVRWKFELAPVSRLRGYATNADVDAAFFRTYKLEALQGRYGTLAPDLVFDPFYYEQQWQHGTWTRPYPEEGSRKWSTLESTGTTNRVTVAVTAMDFGAHGELRAYVDAGCGAWVPVPIRGHVDPTNAGPMPSAVRLQIPDDSDANFMADHYQRYRGLHAAVDADDQPTGDGTAGDGLTAFEEYRGFMTQVGSVCDPLKVRHVRTDPKVKDLFIRVSDPILEPIADDFGLLTASPANAASALSVHTVCPDHYVDDHTRIVNFTMHRNPGEGIHGARLTQERPQHGVYLLDAPLGNGLLGESGGFGPPRNVSRVTVDIAGIRAAYGPARVSDYLRLITLHELGHAVGIRHHGDGNIGGPVVLLDTPGCVVGMTEGLAAGAPACSLTGIAIRGQQNSGNAFCPMKYIQWRWYVPPGWSLRYRGPVDFRSNTTWSWSRPRPQDAYSLLPDAPNSLTSRPQVYRYRKDLDNPPPWTNQQFCTSSTGTGVNALPMDQNHAGHASRTPACAEQLRVNDVPLDSRR
jgi:hypothetical protein